MLTLSGVPLGLYESLAVQRSRLEAWRPRFVKSTKCKVKLRKSHVSTKHHIIMYCFNKLDISNAKS